MRLPRVRVGLRRLLVMLAILAVPIAFWSWRLRTGPTSLAGLDWASAVVTTLAAVSLTAEAARTESRRLHPAAWGPATLAALLAVWFSSVEWAWIEEDCVTCGHGWTITEVRFFSAAPRRQVVHEYPTVIELMAFDLGIPCAHERVKRRRMQRRFGLCLWGECHNGISRLSDPPWPGGMPTSPWACW